MRVVPGSCSLKLVPAQASSSVHIHANFTMKPDLTQPSIIGQTAHNLDEVCQLNSVVYKCCTDLSTTGTTSRKFGSSMPPETR